MKYAKPPLAIDDQVKLLFQRGMDGDPELMARQLTAVNYYRLSEYWHTFRKPDDSFKPGTSFDQVWATYVFDRYLRLLVMDAIERIEIAVRSLMAYHHAHKHGAFAYSEDSSSLPKMSPDDHSEFLARIAEETERSKETFVKHFEAKYGDSHPYLPVWMATEVMSFGSILTFFRNSTNKVKRAVAGEFSLRGMDQPMSVSEYQLLPKDVRDALPTLEEWEAELERVNVEDEA